MYKVNKKNLARILLSAGCLLMLGSVGAAENKPTVAHAISHNNYNKGGSGDVGYWRHTSWNYFISHNRFARYQLSSRIYHKCEGHPVSWLTGGPHDTYWSSISNSSNKARGIGNIPSESLKHAKAHGWYQGGVNIICQYGKKPWHYVKKYLQPYWTSNSYTYNTNAQDGFNISGVYSSSTQLSPEKPDEYANWSPSQQRDWDSTHVAQNSGEVRNAWSDFVDGLSQGSIDLNNPKQSADNIKARSAELTQGNYWQQPSIRMNSQNQQGWKQGGIWDITEFHKVINYFISYKTNTSWRQNQKCQVTYSGYREYKYHTGGPLHFVKDTTQQHAQPCQLDGAPQNLGTTGHVDISQSSPDTPYSWYQMISTRCNKAKFDELTKSIDGFVNDSGASDYATQTGHTRRYWTNGDTSFDNRPLGNDNRGGVLGETAHQSFYQNAQSCAVAIDCFSQKQPGNKYSQVNNGSKDNVQNTGSNAKRDGQPVYGAQADGNSSDAFTFFRDGKTHTLRTDLWYPRAYSGTGIDTNMRFEPANFTRMYFDPSGTPTGSFFGMGINADEYKGSPNGGSEDPAKFVNGNDIANGLSKFAKGELTHFYPHSTWTSDSDNPERFNIDWTWQPDVTSNMYLTVNGNAPRGTDGTGKSKIFVTCPISMDTTNTHKPIIQNNLDPNAQLKPLTSFDSDNGKSVSMDFVRSTASK